MGIPYTAPYNLSTPSRLWYTILVSSEVEQIDVGWIDPGYTTGHFTHSISSSIADMVYFGCFGNVHRMATSLPALGRNMIVEQGFLPQGADWLWMVDSDMVFDKGHVMKLWHTAQDMGVKIVSGLSFIFKKRSQPVPSYFIKSDGKFYPKDQLQMMNHIPEEPTIVEATGLASSLIHRDVFEAMQAPRHEDYRWFDQIPLENNPTLSGEDVQFFIRAKELGFDTVLDPNAETWHVKDVGVGKQDFYRFWELRQQAGLDEE